MKINMLVNRLNHYTDKKLCNQIRKIKDLKLSLRQLRKTARNLEKEIQVESRIGNQKILHAKHRFITVQRRENLSLLKDLTKAH